MPPLIVLIMVGEAGYEMAFPWRRATEALPTPPGNVRVMVALSYRGGLKGEDEDISATYVFLPEILWSPNVHTVRKSPSGEVTVSTARTFIPGDILGFLFMVSLSVIAWKVPTIARAT